MELENQGGSGSALQHWEKRVLGVSGEIGLRVYGGGAECGKGDVSVNGVCLECVCEVRRAVGGGGWVWEAEEKECLYSSGYCYISCLVLAYQLKL